MLAKSTTENKTSKSSNNILIKKKQYKNWKEINLYKIIKTVLWVVTKILLDTGLKTLTHTFNIKSKKKKLI